MAIRRERLDTLLVELGLAESRTRAQALVLAGQVRVEGEPAPKPGTKVPCDSRIEVVGAELPVSRGALKLRGAIERLGLEAEGRIGLDAGASTGGFTEVLLERGVRLVHAVDVGYGQLAWKLRTDPRVRVMERTNLRHADPALFDPRPDLLVMDVSFISVTKLSEALARILAPGSPGLILVKPQFEAGPDRVGKGGVVRDPEVHLAVLRTVTGHLAREGWQVTGAAPSPVLGPAGNREFFLAVRTPLTGPRSSAPGGRPQPDALPIRDEVLAAAVAEPVPDRG